MKLWWIDPTHWLSTKNHPITPCPNKAAVGCGELGLQSICHMWSLLLRSPHSPLLLQCGFLPRDAVLQEQIPHRFTSPASKSAPVWAPLSESTGPAKSLLQHRTTASFRHPPVLVLHRLQMNVYSIMNIHGIQGNSLHQHGLCYEL